MGRAFVIYFPLHHRVFADYVRRAPVVQLHCIRFPLCCCSENRDRLPK